MRLTIDGRLTHVPPAPSDIQRRFAWVNVVSLAGTYAVTGYNAAGAEVFRTGEPAPTLPPELRRTPTPTR